MKNESCLCKQIFARAKYEGWHLKKLFFVLCSISKKLIEKSFERLIQLSGILISFGCFVLLHNRTSIIQKIFEKNSSFHVK